MPENVPVLQRVDIVRARPEAGDTRRLEAIEQRDDVSLDRSVWMVVLSLDHVPEPRGRTLFLYLGDYWIRKYTAFERGIYFKVYDPRFFTKHGGKPFAFVSEDGRVTPTGERLPDRPPQGAGTGAELEGRAFDTAPALPAQRTVLRRIAGR